jgi:(p)ppGpp synthase/HD superfamily hydrolase
MDILGPRFSAALAFANELHGSQVRKGTPIPYIAHLLSVAALVIEHGGDEDEAIAGLLHDAVEDQGGQPMLERIRSRFGQRVADVVAACSDTDVVPKPPWRQRKEQYIAGIAHKSPSALLVSLADKVHNSRAILADLQAHGDLVWQRFSGGKEGTIWYYRQLTDAFRGRTPPRLWEALEEAVQSIEKLSSQGVSGGQVTKAG